jgi:RNA-splicing ligase RtcB
VIPVGGAISVENAIIPSAHSADICCSMLATFYEERGSVTKELDALMSATRFGPEHRHLDDLVHDPVNDEDVWANRFLTGLRDRARTQIADQGDGNHFAYIGEVDVGESLLVQLRLAGHTELAGRLEVRRYRVLVTHHGSRSLGAHVYKRGQVAAEKHVSRTAQQIPAAAAWLDANSDTGRDYWHALQYVARWTKANHRAIHRRFLERIGGIPVAEVGNEHNFVWQRGDEYFHGKGATPAWKDAHGRPQLGLIPLNMAEPILLVLGSDREEFLSFAPHGAGRNLSRTAMKRRFPDPVSRRHAIESSTAGIEVRWYCGSPDLSETPLAYKNAAQVKEQIREFGLAEVIAEIRPLGCIMAGDSGRSWRNREEELTPKQKRQIEHRAERRRIRQDLRDDW